MWSVDPATAGPQHIDDPADHPTIVHPRLASRVRRQMRLDLRKLIVRQPKKVPIHQRFLSEAVNHMPDIMPTTLWVRTLVWELTRKTASPKVRVANEIPGESVSDGRISGTLLHCATPL